MKGNFFAHTCSEKQHHLWNYWKFLSFQRHMLGNTPVPNNCVIWFSTKAISKLNFYKESFLGRTVRVSTWLVYINFLYWECHPLFWHVLWVSKNPWLLLHTQRRGFATFQKKLYPQKCQGPFKCHCLKKYFENAPKWAVLEMSTLQKLIIIIKMYLSSHVGITFIQVFMYAYKKYIRWMLKAVLPPQGNRSEHFSQSKIHRLLHK